MKILKLSPDDIKSNEQRLAVLINESFKSVSSYYQEDMDFCLKEVNRMCDYAEKNADIYGAFTEELIGFIWFFPREFFGTKRVHINHIAIMPEYRRKGIGKELMSTAIERAKEINADVVDLFVTTSSQKTVSFYQSMDFNTERYLMSKVIKSQS